MQNVSIAAQVISQKIKDLTIGELEVLRQLMYRQQSKLEQDLKLSLTDTVSL